MNYKCDYKNQFSYKLLTLLGINQAVYNLIKLIGAILKKFSSFGVYNLKVYLTPKQNISYLTFSAHTKYFFKLKHITVIICLK